MFQAKLQNDSGRPAGDPALARDDDTRCGVCHHESHGDGACPTPYCLCDEDAP